MKRLTILAGMCMVVFLLVGCKTIESNVVKQSTMGEIAYSYIDIDPMVIGENWEHIITVPSNQFFVEMYFSNPDTDAAIQFATLIVTPGSIAGYSYMLNGKINVCEFKPETNAYESSWESFTEDNKQQWRDDYATYFDLGESC